jgi:hypothetical protein
MKKVSPIAGGVIGAILGFFAVLIVFGLLGTGIRADAIMSGLLLLLVFAPVGALAGLMIGTKLALRARGQNGAGEFVAGAFKALGVTVLMVAAGGAMTYFYFEQTATPWLNPNAATPELHYEIRLPANAALPASRDVAVELKTDLNTMPGELASGKFRRDGNQPVIVGQVEMAFRTARRQLAVQIAGQPDRLYPIGLTAKAPHSSELGAWQRLADGSEIRYRAKWPGKE